MRGGGCQREVGPDTGAEAQLRETFCAEEMEGGKKDSLISPLGGAVKPSLPHYQSSLHPCPHADPLLPCPGGIRGTQQAAPGLSRRRGEVPGQGLVPSMRQDVSSPQGDSEPRWHAPCLLPLAGPDWASVCCSLMNRIDSTFSCCLPKWQVTHLID